VKRAGYFGDGANLWLQVSEARTKSWLCKRQGKQELR